MADETTRQERSPKRPLSIWDVGEQMGDFFPGQADEQPDEEPDAESTEQEAADAEELPEQEQPEAEAGEEDEDVSEDEDAEPEAEDTSEGFRLNLTVDGEEVVVEDEEEARSLAQRGMHYTKEMQALREEQREWESEKQEITAELRQEQNQYKAALDTLEQTFAGVLGDEPDWTSPEIQRLREENPRQYAQLRDQWDQLRTIRAEQQRISREQQEEYQKQAQQWVQDQQDKLRSKKPEWTDASKRDEDFSKMRDYALEIGVSDEELNNLYDHRFWIVLHDAARYRQAQSSGKKQAQAAKSKKKSAKPGSGGNKTDTKRRKHRKLRERLRETGDVNAAGAIFQDMMTEGG